MVETVLIRDFKVLWGIFNKDTAYPAKVIFMFLIQLSLQSQQYFLKVCMSEETRIDYTVEVME